MGVGTRSRSVLDLGRQAHLELEPHRIARYPARVEAQVSGGARGGSNGDGLRCMSTEGSGWDDVDEIGTVQLLPLVQCATKEYEGGRGGSS